MNKAKMFLRRNGPTILSVAAAATIGVAEVLTVRGTIKAVHILDEENKKEESTKVDKIKKVIPAYIPAAIAVTTAIACIFASNDLNKKQRMALAGVCATMTNSLADYKKFVVKEFGEDGLEKVENDIVEEIIPDVEPHDGYELYFDWYSNKFFEAKPKDVSDCMYEYNRLYQQNGIVSVGDFYRYLENIVLDKDEFLDPNDWDEVGFCYSEMVENCDVVNWIDFNDTDRTTGTGKHYHWMGFQMAPSAFYEHPEWIDEGWLPGPDDGPKESFHLA